MIAGGDEFLGDAESLLTGAALALAAAQPFQRRATARAATVGAQAVAVAIAAAAAGWRQGMPSLLAAGLATAACNGVALPLLIARRWRGAGPAASSRSVAAAALAAALVAGVVLLLRPATDGAGDFAAVLAAPLLGLATAATARGAPAQAASLLALGNGLILLAALMPGVPVPGLAVLAVLASGAVAVLLGRMGALA